MAVLQRHDQLHLKSQTYTHSVHKHVKRAARSRQSGGLPRQVAARLKTCPAIQLEHCQKTGGHVIVTRAKGTTDLVVLSPGGVTVSHLACEVAPQLHQSLPLELHCKNDA